jgi:hypothetical protein
MTVVAAWIFVSTILSFCRIYALASIEWRSMMTTSRAVNNPQARSTAIPYQELHTTLGFTIDERRLFLPTTTI